MNPVDSARELCNEAGFKFTETKTIGSCFLERDEYGCQQIVHVLAMKDAEITKMEMPFGIFTMQDQPFAECLEAMRNAIAVFRRNAHFDGEPPVDATYMP